MASKAFPMFPLQSVLFPGAPMPLHVFEPRYRELTEACLRGDGRFGVVLIERGREVGGGDSRFAVGTVARILEAARTPDGRYLLATVGVERLRVRRWLPDDPYPRADVEMVAELDPVEPRASQLRAEVQDRLVRVLALWSQLDARVPDPGSVQLDADPVRASFQAGALAPIGPLDRQRLLERDDPGERLELLRSLLADEEELLQLRLGG